MSELRKIDLTKLATLMDQFPYRIDGENYGDDQHYYHYQDNEYNGYDEHISISTPNSDDAIDVAEILGFDTEGTLFFKDFNGIKYHMEFFDKLTTYSLLDEGL